jgi:predicted RNA binding protein YcfA (HicA-like mRNA interferase family)
MKWSELKRIAIKNGWYLHRHGGEHDVYKHDQKPYKIMIGRHDKQEVPTGTFKALKKQIGF